MTRDPKGLPSGRVARLIERAAAASMRPLVALALLAVLVLPAGAWPLGQGLAFLAPPSADLPSRDDAPLPDRVSRRLGTLRWRDKGKPWSIAFSPDGARLASAGPLRLWYAESGEVCPLLADDKDNSLVALSKDGKMLAAGGIGWTSVRLWSLSSNKKPEVTDEVSGGFVHAIALSPDGKWLAIGSENKLFVWDVQNRKFRFQTENTDTTLIATFEALAFSPDGKFLAFAQGGYHERASGDVDIRLWNTDTGEVVRKLRGHKRKVMALAFSPDGKTLAAASMEEPVRLWDPEKGEVLREFPFTDCRSLAFSPDGRRLATAEYTTNEIRLWDPGTGDELTTIKNCGYGLRSLAFSPDGKTLAGAGEMRAIRLWDAKTGEELPQFAGHWDPVRFIAFSPDGRTLASRSSDTTVRLWDLASGKCKRTLSYGQYGGDHPATGEAAGTLVFSPEAGKLIGLGGYEPPHEYAFFVWDVNSGAREAEVEEPRISSHTATVSLAPDGDTVAMADDYGVHLWSLGSGKPVKDFVVRVAVQKHQWSDKERCAVFSPDGRTLATSDFVDHVIRLWDWKAGVRIREIPIDGKSLDCLAFSPDGQLLAGCNPGPACVWETATGKLLRKFGEGRQGTKTVAFAPDGRRLIVATKAFVDVWDVFTGEELSAPDGKPLLSGGHKGDILCAAISPDGKTIASGGADTTILLWDAHDLLPKTPATNPNAKALDRLWDDLRSDDAPAAYKAILALLGAPDKAAALLKERVPPAAKPDAKRVKELIAALDAPELEAREAASRELGKLGEAVEPALREALAGQPLPEAKLRCERLLEAIQKGALDAEDVRRLRAVQVLERVGTPEARTALKALADGAPGRLSREAQLALDRLDRP